MHRYRVFVSYSREDQALARKLVDHLECIGFHPIWDENLRPGDRFSDVIKAGIAHAHVFLPILTEKSVGRPWVHQETGYAMGLEVPVLPVTVELEPGEMIQDLHAMKVASDLGDLRPDVLVKDIERLLARKRPESESTFRCAASPEMRAECLGDYTREAMENDADGPLRQSGAFTSFNLPLRPPDDEIWKLRDAPVKRSAVLYEFLYEERQAFEAYARKQGCDLIICPSMPLGEYGPAAHKLRLETLLKFLEDTTVKNVRVAVREHPVGSSLTIVGDWFVAESFSPRPGKGYFHTNFTWHAPTVLARLRKFDRDFAIRIQEAEAGGRSSREVAIDCIKAAIASIQA